MGADLGFGRTRDEYPLAVSTMYGLGDTIYQRPFLRAWGKVLGDVYVRNPWPDLLDDLDGLHLCHPHGAKGLRTQSKNVERHVGAGREWAQWPVVHQGVTCRYFVRADGSTILEELERHLPLNGEPLVMDLPDFGPPPAVGWDGVEPLAVLRPVTYRREWVNTARPPLHEYMHQAAELLSDEGYHVVSVADLDPPKEWIGEPIPIADHYALRGELDVRALLALIQAADVCVGGVGFLVPAALAARTPLVGICGGQGQWNSPDVITDPRIDAPAAFIKPDDYCMCPENLHDCRKEITDFAPKFIDALHEATA